MFHKNFFCITFLSFLIILLAIIGFETPQKEQTQYLRIHVRANSNLEIDQDVKIKVKNELVSYLTPVLSQCKTKENAERELNLRLEKIQAIADSTLKEQGFSYKSQVKINNELFPTREYQGLVLNAGFYDALIVELGEAKGDNWWCVVYPPLCFVGQGTGYQYKSKLLEIIRQFYKIQGENNEKIS